ncbi:MAG: sensor histidine kinase [Ferruginibacter sp.]|nr:sensor histidine kinase [Ferruginibacter sp.]
MAEKSNSHLLLRIKELESQLEESNQLIDAIKAGEVDAFAISKENESQIYTLQSGDYAYRVLIEEIGEAAINVTEDGLIVYTNPYFYNLLRLPYEKVIGATIFDFIDAGSMHDFSRLFKESLAGKSKGEINLSVHNSFIPVYISLTSLQPKLATVGIIITDLSGKKKNEGIIMEYQKDLENKNRELIKSNAELASFAYIASHDLQEPLRKIQTFATRIMEKERNSLSENGKDYFGRMQVAAKRMQTLIEDLLTYSRTNTIERKFENAHLNKIVEEVKADLHEELLEKQATLDATDMCAAQIIPFQFRQLFYNLISNSLKFSNPSHSPAIKIKSEIATGKQLNNNKLSGETNYCHISISDNGIGFEQQYNEKIFEVFQRLHGRSQYNGTGIGLSIVKKIVENHDGIITARAEINKGATFDIYIPAIH